MLSSRLLVRFAAPPWRRHDLHLRREIQQVQDRLYAGVQFGRSRCSIDVPGVRIPRQHIERCDPHFLEQDRLQLCTPVIVLDADESAPDPILRRGPRVSQDASGVPLDAAVSNATSVAAELLNNVGTGRRR